MYRIDSLVRQPQEGKRRGFVRRFLIRAFLAGVPFGIAIGVFTSLIFGEGILLGLASGAFFGVWMAAATAFSHKRGQRHPPELDGEEVFFRSQANHIRGIEAVGGWLLLTDQRLVFRPHRWNIQKAEWSVPLPELIRMEPRRTMGIVPNGMRAVTASGEERFVVEDRMSWLREVELAKSGGPAA